MVASTRKRRKVASNDDENKENAVVTRKGHTGKQPSNDKDATFAGLPFDVLLEIAAFCLPLDVLHLTLVNKTLRATFISKSSASAWKAARSNLEGFPPPFEGTSEPAWVHLAFIKICHFCWKKVVVIPEFVFQCRICPACAKIHLIEVSEALATRGRDKHDMLREIFLNVVPTRSITAPGGKKKLHHAIRKDFLEAERRFLSNSMTTELLAEHQDRMLRFREYIEVCNAWRDDQREKELEEMKSRRREAIWERLAALGYQEDLEAMEDLDMFFDFATHSGVKGTATLTDRGWDKVRADVIRFAEQVREARKFKRHLIIVNQRKLYASVALRKWKAQQLMPLPKYLPTIADFCEFPHVKEILERPDHHTVYSHNFDMRKMDKLCLRWRVQLYRRMCSVAGKENPTGPGTGQAAYGFLHLAKNVFICTDLCSVDLNPGASRKRKKSPIGSPLWFPEYMTHSCCVAGLVDGKRDDVPDRALGLDGYTRSGRFYHGRVPWRGDKVLRKDDVMEGIVTKVIGLAGLDADTATVADMDATSTLFECRTCPVMHEVGEGISDDTPDREMMHWRVCVAHVFKHHYFEHEYLESIVRVSEDGSTPDGFYAVESQTLDFLYECVRCRDRPADTPGGRRRYQVVNHCLDVHNIAHPRENADFGELPGSRPEGRRRHKVLLFSHEREIEMMTAKRHVELNGKLLGPGGWSHRMVLG